jgi:hypothetical protein
LGNQVDNGRFVDYLDLPPDDSRFKPDPAVSAGS